MIRKLNTFFATLILLLPAMTCQSCNPHPDLIIRVENQSDHAIYVSKNQYYHFSSYSDIVLSGYMTKLMPGDVFDNIFNEVDYSNDTFNIIIISEPALNQFLEPANTDLTIPIEICQRYTYSELEAMDFKIIYTGE